MVNVTEDCSKLIIENSFYTIEYMLENGKYSIKDKESGRYVIVNACAYVCTDRCIRGSNITTPENSGPDFRSIPDSSTYIPDSGEPGVWSIPNNSTPIPESSEPGVWSIPDSSISKPESSDPKPRSLPEDNDTIITYYRNDPLSFNDEDTGRMITIYRKMKDFTLGLGFHVPENKGYLLLKASVENSGSYDITLKDIYIITTDSGASEYLQTDDPGFLDLAGDPEDCYVYTNTYYKTPSMVRKITDGFNSGLLGDNNDIEYFERDRTPYWQSKYDGAICCSNSGQSIVFGFITFKRFMGEIDIRYDKNSMGNKIGTFTLYNSCNDYIIKPGSTCNSEQVYLNFCGDVYENQIHYAKTTGRCMDAKVMKEPVSGWCSWHSRFFDINEDFILKNAEFAAARKDIFPVMPGGFQYIQVDYGWQKYLGSNEADLTRFPNGMKCLSDRIHASGFKSGIWIAPFWIEEGCEIKETNPDFLLKDAEGNFIIEPGLKGLSLYRLDVSNPEAVRYVIKLLDQIINEWGYDMVKMDFLEMSTIRPMDQGTEIRLYNSELTSYEHFRNACKTMQDYVDSLDREVFLSPCGSPTMFLTGIFKSNYVAEDAIVKMEPDGWNEHAGVKAFVRSWATKYYLNSRLWTNNCESVILNDKRPYNEALINATSAALTGGVYFTGDELTNLSEERLAIYSRILPLYSKTAIPVDLFENTNPVTWKLSLEAHGEQWLVLGLFNLEDREQDFNISALKLNIREDVEYLVYDFWDQRLEGEFIKSFTLKKVPARCALLLCIREKKPRPFVLSADIHFTQGAVEFENLYWFEDSMTLKFKLEKYRLGTHKVHVCIPEGYSIKDIFPCDINYNIIMESCGKICTLVLRDITDDVIIVFNKSLN